jgi:hypothetical protein
MFSRFQERVRSHGSIARALVSLLLGANTLLPSTTSEAAHGPTIPDRVAAVRASISAVAKPNAASQPGASSEEKPVQLAQWLNWGNWANWNNWRNWGNWGNWGNWRNA